MTSAPDPTGQDIAATAAPGSVHTYVIDPSHSQLGFAARHAMVTTVRGAFRKFDGTARIDTARPDASSIEVVIESASVDTGNAQRDEHLRSADFLNVGRFPKVSFVGSKVRRKGDDLTVTGDLTIKDVTRTVSIDFIETGSAKDPYGNTRVGFEGSAAIKRKDWGLTWNTVLETGGVLVSDKITLTFDISAIRSE